MDKEEQEILELKHRIFLVDSNAQRANKLKYILDGLYITDVIKSIEDVIYRLNNGDIPDILISRSLFETAESYLTTPSNLQGLDLCKYISNHSNQEIKIVPTIILMSQDDVKLKAQLFEAGASDVLDSDFEVLDLFARIDAHIRQLQDRKNLVSSLQELLDEHKERNKRHVDIRAKILAKHKETVLVFEKRIIKLREEISQKNQEMEKAKLYIRELEKENQRLLNQLQELRKMGSKITNTTTKEKNILDSISKHEENEIQHLLEHLKKEHGLEEELIKKITQSALNNEFNFKRIDNFYFIHNFASVVKKHVHVELEYMANHVAKEDYNELCKKYIDHLSEAILKQYKHKFLFFFSKALLEAIGDKDSNATKFLKFYDGRIEITSDGKRFQKPIIEGEDGENDWNMISMLQAINQRTVGYKNLLGIQSEMTKIQKNLQNLEQEFRNLFLDEKNISLESLENENIEKQFDMFEDYLINERNQINSQKDNFRIKQIVEKRRQLEIIRDKYQKYQAAYETLSNKYNQQLEYNRPAEEKFNRVARAVAKALLNIKVIDT